MEFILEITNPNMFKPVYMKGTSYRHDKLINPPSPGEAAIRNCGSYWVYCDGRCNSCDKGSYTTSDHTTKLNYGTYSADLNVPLAYLWG